MSDGSYILPPIGGLAPVPGMGQSYLPERYSAPYESVLPTEEPIPTSHPWMASRTAPNKFRLVGGKVFGSDGTSVEVTDPLTVETTVDGWTAWVKITRAGVSVTAAEFGQGDTVPTDTALFTYWPVVRFPALPGGGNPYLTIDQLESAHLRLSVSGTGINHPWKVTKGPQIDGGGEREWLINEGTVYSQGAPFLVASTAVNTNGSIIVLKITRDSASREVTGAVIEVDPLGGTEPPTSSETEQFIPIAIVDDASQDPPLQLLFEEVRIWEEMSVQNGVFLLNAYNIAHRNFYSPPP